MFNLIRRICLNQAIGITKSTSLGPVPGRPRGGRPPAPPGLRNRRPALSPSPLASPAAGVSWGQPVFLSGEPDDETEVYRTVLSLTLGAKYIVANTLP